MITNIKQTQGAMKTIVETPGEPYMIEDRTTPVYETKKHKSRLWLSLHEAMSVTGESIKDIAESANSKVPTKSGLQFGWPPRGVLTKYLPDYAVVRRANAQQPVPVTAVFSLGTGRNKITEDLHYRSISQFSVCNELNWSRANKLLARQHGWRQLLPALMTNVVQHSPGWTPPGGWAANPGAKLITPLFDLSVARGQLRVKYIGPTSAARFSDLPPQVIANSR